MKNLKFVGLLFFILLAAVFLFLFLFGDIIYPGLKGNVNKGAADGNKVITKSDGLGGLTNRKGNSDVNVEGNVKEGWAKSNCYLKKIAYSIGNKNESSSCLEFSGGRCTKKEFYCSVKLKNLDFSIGGNFSGNLLFLDKDNLEEPPIEVFSFRYFIGPRETFFIEHKKTINETFANKNISCFYEAIKTPKKEICY